MSFITRLCAVRGGRPFNNELGYASSIGDRGLRVRVRGGLGHSFRDSGKSWGSREQGGSWLARLGP